MQPFFFGPPGEAPGPNAASLLVLRVSQPAEVAWIFSLRQLSFLLASAGAGAATASRPATAPRCSSQTADRGSHDSYPGTSDLTSRDQWRSEAICSPAWPLTRAFLSELDAPKGVTWANVVLQSVACWPLSATSWSPTLVLSLFSGTGILASPPFLLTLSLIRSVTGSFISPRLTPHPSMLDLSASGEYCVCCLIFI